MVLTFLFGPFGLLYVSVIGGIVMLIVSLVIAIATLGLGLILVWPVVMLWAALAASAQHSRYQHWLAMHAHRS